MVAGTPSFADELVTRVLVDGGAALLRAEHVTREFGEYLVEAARDHGVAERLRTARAALSPWRGRPRPSRASPSPTPPPPLRRGRRRRPGTQARGAAPTSRR